MTKNNIYLPKENIAKVETIQELKNEYKVPSYEEFMKTYNEDKETVDNYENEFDSYGDIRVKGTYYGPGFWDDIKGFVKPVASGALIAASLFPPTAALAVPITATVVGAGATATGIGHLADSEGWKKAGRDIIEIAANGHQGQEMVGEARNCGALPRLKE